MDEQRLSELFRTAAGDPPPASFGTEDVVHASRRATARRRSALAGGSLLGIAVLAGGVLLGGQAPRPVPEAPAAPATSGVSPDGVTPFLAPPGAATTCPFDGRLAAELAAVLDGEGAAVPIPEPCRPGTRGAALPVAGGTVYVLLGPGPTPSGQGIASVPADGGRLAVVAAPPSLVGDLDALAQAVAARL